MRVIVGLVVAVILLLVLMPLWGMIGALAYGGPGSFFPTACSLMDGWHSAPVW